MNRQTGFNLIHRSDLIATINSHIAIHQMNDNTAGVVALLALLYAYDPGCSRLKRWPPVALVTPDGEEER